MLKEDEKHSHFNERSTKLFSIITVSSYLFVCLLWIVYIKGFLLNLADKYSGLFLDNLINIWLPIVITSCFIYITINKSIFGIKVLNKRRHTEYDSTYNEVSITKEELRNQLDEINSINIALRQEMDSTNSILDNAGIFIIVWDIEGNLLELNNYGQNTTGFSIDEVSGAKWELTLLDRNNKLRLHEELNNIKDAGISVAHEGKVNCKNGKEIYALWNKTVLYSGDGSPEKIIWMGIDITEQKNAEKKLLAGYQELEAVYEELTATEEELKQNFDELQRQEQELHISEERYRLALEGSRDALWDWDIKRGKSFVSERWREMLGYEAEDLAVNHLTWKDLIHPDDKERAFQAQKDHLDGKTPFYTSEYRLKMKNGEYKWIMVRGKVLRDREGKPIRIAGSQTDISERKNFEEKINKMAYYDSLTGLPNRALFEKLLNESITASIKNNLRGAVLFLDLDNFKTVNDTFGHALGDELLKCVASLLRSFEIEGVKVSRFGGDEFVIMVHDAKSDEHVTELAREIVQALNRPWLIDGKEFYNSVSIGIVFYPQDGSDAQSILRNADCAMYSVKESGKDSFRVYSYKMNSKFAERIIIENSLRHALERNEFMLHYQPQVNQKTGEIIGVEALIRWNNSSRGLLSPGEFIPIAEDTGLIVPIGEWVLREACKQNKQWQDMGYKKFSIAVNISARQLKQPEIIDRIRIILDETGLEAKYLCLEITESIAISDIDFAINVLEDLKEIGVNIALDDFGTGCSSLSYLRRLPINTVKIDKSFVNEINENEHGAAITEAIIIMAHKMSIKVIAEGVETWNQHKFLSNKNCDMAQGYLYKRPLTVEGIEELIRTNGILSFK